MNLLKRSVVAAVGIPLIYLAIRLGTWYFIALVTAQAALAAGEFFQLARKKGLRPLVLTGTLAAGLLPSAVYIWLQCRPEWLLPAGFGAFILICLACLCREGAVEGPLAGISTTIFGVLYGGGLLCLQVILRHDLHYSNQEGFYWVFLIYLLTWSVDIGGYLAGSLFGRHKPFPQLSPGKTVEGFIGGLLLVTLVSYLVGVQWMKLYGIPAAAALALLIGLIAPLGDLVESLFKRDAGVKDSSHILPGHGGVLDRFDSLIFAVPVALLFRNLIN